MSLLTQLARHADTRVNRRSAFARLAGSGGTVSGKVAGPNHGDLTSTIVYLYNVAQQALTAPALPIVASNGAYKIEGVPPGKWMAFCQPAPQTPLAAQTCKSKAAFTTRGTPIAISDGQRVAGVNFHLPPAGLLTVTVLDSAGAPVSGAIVLSFLVQSDRLSTGTRPPPTTDATGSTNLANVPLQSQLAVLTPNHSRVWWDGAASKEKSKAVVIPSQGAVVPVTVQLPAGA